MSARTIRRTIAVSALRPEPEVLRIIGAESERNGTSKLTPRQVDRIIRASRSHKAKR
jgi:hypothetical protein